MKPSFPLLCRIASPSFALAILAAGCVRPEEHLERGFAALRAEDAKTAIREVNKAEKGLPPSGTLQYNRGAALYRLGRMEEAAQAFEASLNLEPGDGETLTYLGFACLGLQKWGEAREAFRKAALAADDPTDSLLAMGLAEIGDNRPDIARLRFLEAQRNRPDEPATYFNLGRLYQNGMHMLDVACDNYEVFLRMAPANDPRRPVAAEAIELLKAAGVGGSAAIPPDSVQRDVALAEREFKAAEEARKHGKTREACNGYSRALRADPIFFDAAMRLGYSYLGLNDPASAAMAFQQAVNIRPNDNEALYLLAYALYNKGDYELASETLDAAITKYPREARLFMLMSYVRIRQQRKEEARAYGEYYVSIADPSKERESFAAWLRAL